MVRHCKARNGRNNLLDEFPKFWLFCESVAKPFQAIAELLIPLSLTAHNPCFQMLVYYGHVHAPQNTTCLTEWPQDVRGTLDGFAIEELRATHCILLRDEVCAHEKLVVYP